HRQQRLRLSHRPRRRRPLCRRRPQTEPWAYRMRIAGTTLADSIGAASYYDDLVAYFHDCCSFTRFKPPFGRVSLLITGQPATSLSSRGDGAIRKPKPRTSIHLYFFSSSFATASRWTSSGPSANLRVRAPAQAWPNRKSSVTPAPPCA